MRNVVVYELLSLDGVAEQPEDFILDFDEVMEKNLGRVAFAAVSFGQRGDSLHFPKRSTL